jgi:hypothetical protein
MGVSGCDASAVSQNNAVVVSDTSSDTVAFAPYMAQLAINDH